MSGRTVLEAGYTGTVAQSGPAKVRTVRRGVPHNDLGITAYTDGNHKLFLRILDLYVLSGSIVADGNPGAAA